MMKKDIFVIIFIIILIGVGLFLEINKKIIMEKKIDEINLLNYEAKLSVDEIKEVKELQSLDGANPRFKIIYKGGEVSYLDHEGNIMAIGNVTGDFIFANLSWNDLYGYPVACTEGYAVTQINDSITCTKAALMDYNNQGNLNVTGNQTIEGVFFEKDTTNHYIYDNASCIIMQSGTTELRICE